MWQTLSAAIVAKVATSSYIESSLIFDYAKTNLDGFPAVTVVPSTGDGVFADTVRNRRSYIFSIKVYQEQLEQGREDSERIMRTIVDDLIDKFDADSYLDNALQGRGYAKPIPGNWDFILGENTVQRVAEILIDCQVIE